MNVKDIEVGRDYRLAGQEAWIVRVVETNGGSLEVELLQCDGTPKANENVGDHLSVSARELSPIEVGAVAAVRKKRKKRDPDTARRPEGEKTGTKYSLHSLCKLFPALLADELQALADDIQQNGQRHPILLYKGKVIDGKNRLKACQMAGVEPVFEEWRGDGSVLDFVVSGNLHRRHLTPPQRAALAVDLKPYYDQQAKERQRLSAGRGAKGDKVAAAEKGKSSVHVAKVCGTNPRYVEIAEKIKKSKPKLLDQVRSGEIGLLEAQRAIKVPSKHKATPLTPTGVCQFIHDLISQQYEVRTVLDLCGTDDGLTTPWAGCKVLSLKRTEFFKHSKPIECTLVLCRPPSDTAEAFLKRIVALVPKTTPIALLAPVTFRSSNKKAEQRWRWLRDKCPPITGIVTLPSDIFPSGQQCEVLLFNLGKLNPHYFLPNEYLHWRPAKAEAA